MMYPHISHRHTKIKEKQQHCYGSNKCLWTCPIPLAVPPEIWYWGGRSFGRKQSSHDHTHFLPEASEVPKRNCIYFSPHNKEGIAIHNEDDPQGGEGAFSQNNGIGHLLHVHETWLELFLATAPNPKKCLFLYSPFSARNLWVTHPSVQVKST